MKKENCEDYVIRELKLIIQPVDHASFWSNFNVSDVSDVGCIEGYEKKTKEKSKKRKKKEIYKTKEKNLASRFIKMKNKILANGQIPYQTHANNKTRTKAQLVAFGIFCSNTPAKSLS